MRWGEGQWMLVFTLQPCITPESHWATMKPLWELEQKKISTICIIQTTMDQIVLKQWQSHIQSSLLTFQGTLQFICYKFSIHEYTYIQYNSYARIVLFNCRKRHILLLFFFTQLENNGLDLLVIYKVTNTCFSNFCPADERVQAYKKWQSCHEHIIAFILRFFLSLPMTNEIMCF